MTEWMLGALAVSIAMLATVGATAWVAAVFLRLGREQGRDMQYHEDLHAGGVGELSYEEPEDVEPEPVEEPEPPQVRVTVVDSGSGPRHALRPDVWTAPEDVDETLWPAAVEEPGTERLPAVAQ
jgi:hypothetical protein